MIFMWIWEREISACWRSPLREAGRLAGARRYGNAFFFEKGGWLAADGDDDGFGPRGINPEARPSAKLGKGDGAHASC